MIVDVIVGAVVDVFLSLPTPFAVASNDRAIDGHVMFSFSSKDHVAFPYLVSVAIVSCIVWAYVVHLSLRRTKELPDVIRVICIKKSTKLTQANSEP